MGDTLQTFHLLPSQSSQYLSVDSVAFSSAQPHQATVNIQAGKTIHSVTVPGGSASIQSTGYVSTAYHSWLLADMILSHSVGDVCPIGPRGCGKSALVKQMTDLLGYRTETIQLYADMTARDLLQQRTTTETGDTVWRLSPLVEAAIEGKLAVLDGLHRVHRGTLAVLQRLVHDRELQLYDGSRLLGQDKYDVIKEENGLSDKEMADRGVHVIHPAFRLFALAEPPTVGTAKGQWMSPEILAMFRFHEMRAQNLAVMEAMLQDFLLGEHLLLVGNQGTGKNKLVDRLLHLLNKPREYIQLNRDTTVQTLTLQPTVREGVIVYDDSPLVQAAKSGNILVVDEADKAPTNVTCILKSLVETGEMILSDGRRIVPSNSPEEGDNITKMHPDFRMFVLANRPGFPFLGNDFFGTLGDLFAC